MRKLMLALAVATAGCAAPTTVIRTVDTRPAIALTGAPSGSVLFVDGVAIGDPSAYDGRPNVLRIEPGTHEIDIRDASGRSLFNQRVFVESELKTIQVH